MTVRRLVLGTLAGTLLTAGGAVRAQTPGKVVRIGWLSGVAIRGSPGWDAFADGMRELGWIADRDYTVDNLLSEGRNERLPALAAELVRRNVDLIVCSGTPPTTAAMSATTTIPILFFYVGDPVGSGFVASLARPGGNITGLGGLGPGMHAKQLELLRQVVPKASRIAVLFNPQLSFHATFKSEVESAARSLGVALRPVELRSPDDIDAAFATLAREPVDALQIFGQPFLFAHGARVARLAAEQRLPATIPFVEVVRDGLLMSYASKLIDDLRRLPYFVDRILKGARPADLPVEQPARFYLTINLKAARAIGVTVPQGVLLRADEVIQ